MSSSFEETTKKLLASADSLREEIDNALVMLEAELPEYPDWKALTNLNFCLETIAVHQQEYHELGNLHTSLRSKRVYLQMIITNYGSALMRTDPGRKLLETLKAQSKTLEELRWICKDKQDVLKESVNSLRSIKSGLTSGNF